MLKSCYRKPDSDPPACGVHDVQLEECSELMNPDAPFLGYLVCLKCPFSGTVVLDKRGFRERVPG